MARSLEARAGGARLVTTAYASASTAAATFCSDTG